MRHRAQSLGTNQTTPSKVGTVTLEAHVALVPGPSESATPGRHRAEREPLIPKQPTPRHDDVPAPARTPGADAEPAECRVARTAHWRASHLPRVLAVAMLVAACLGATALAVNYAEVRSPDNAVALATGVAVIVGLWALLIASAPQVVTLSGSVLTVKSSRGVETFDLADALQPVDLVAEPRAANWALLLHRTDGSSLVLRRRDVAAAELDPIVRHHRRVAELARADRQARFER